MTTSSEAEGQGQRKLPLLFAFMGAPKLARRLLVLSVLFFFGSVGHAIPPNTPITNTATLDYAVSGIDYSASDNETVVTDPSSGNSPPHELILDPPSVDENADGAVVGALSISDLDPSDTHTIVVSDPRFEVVGTTLRLRAGESLDFESEPSVALTFTVTDSAAGELIVLLVVAVVDVNEAPTDIALSNATLVANQAGAVVGDLTVTDPDVGDAHTYSVNDPRFEVVDGQLKLLDAEALALGTVVTVEVTATDAGGLTYVESFDITVVPPGGGSGVNSSISFQQYAPGAAGAQSVGVAVAQCDAGAGYLDMPDPRTASGDILAMPATLDLNAVAAVKSGDVAFVQVIDPDANLDAATIDRVQVVLSTGSGDSEALSLGETSPNSGVFVGYVQTGAATVLANNCLIETAVDDSLTATYTDASDATDSAAASVLVDPYGVVFDSATGTMINGATITIIDQATGQPAQVFADDGASAFPAAVTSGDNVMSFPRGAYRFPFVASGDYAFLVTPPNRFAFPSAAVDVDLQALPGAPFSLGPGSRGQPFNVPVGPAIRIDIPLDLQPVVPTSSDIALLAVPAGNATTTAFISEGQCFDGSGFVPQGAPLSLARGVLATPASVAVNPADRYTRGDVIVIRVTDPDQDLDPFAPDTIAIDVAVPGQSDRERVELSETNDSTGIFTGYVQTSTAAPTINNCVLEAAQGSEFEASYVDSGDATDTSTATGLLDPGFTVFSSATGERLNGARVTLIDTATGQPALVYAADGVTSFPAELISGQSATDGGGQIYAFATGSFFYPRIPAGSYRLEIEPPLSYLFPSGVDDGTLANLPAGPFVLNPGSRGELFTVSPAVPNAFDIPLDPIQADVFVGKQASKDAAAVGDFVQYQITVQNNDESGTVSNVRLVDILPVGFRYMDGSLTVADISTQPVIGPNGRNLELALPDMGPGDLVEIKYVAEVGAGSQLGPARNLANVVGVGIGSSNTAFADVLVTEDLFQSNALIVGQVFDGPCGAVEKKGLAGARIWLEDGTFVVTDASGKFHFEGVTPGTHVVQFDAVTLPGSHELISCESNTRFAGAKNSQFVDLQAGSIWRTDFYVDRKPNTESEIIARLDSEAEEGYVHYRYHVKGGPVPLANMRATFVLDEQLAYVGQSIKINGERKPDPAKIDSGAMTFWLPDTDEDFEYTIEFDAFVKSPRGLIETKSMMMFQSEAGRHRTEVNVNELSLNWPSSLIVVAESVGSKERNRRALLQARSANANRLEPTEDRANPGDRNRPSRGELGIRSSVSEPSRGSNRSRSNVSSTLVSVETKAQSNEPYQLPKLDRGEAPPFDLAWLEAVHERPGIAWPPERYNPAIPAVAVAVVHSKGLTPQVLVDGKLVNPLTFEGTTTHHELGVSVTRWDNVTVSEADSLIEAKLLDRDGNTVEEYSRPVHFSGAPASAELIKQESYLVADGLYPPVLAVRLRDRQGFPLRPGSTGDFSVLAPYEPFDQTKHLENVDNEMNNQRFQVLNDGVAYLKLEPTTATGEVRVNFQFDQVRSETIRARLTPGAREWIMVGLVEGSYAHNTLEGNLQNLAGNDLANKRMSDGRVAFYAKGMVPGKWLLTAAYDTDKKFERKLREQIDPNQFYTLYGDGTQQRYDAESQQKLYLKLEKDRFSGLFGDFDVDFNRSELTRYDRRMNGLNLGLFGERVEVNAFASHTDQAFVRDELRGDGTSGVYRLSNRRLVVNSEVVKIVTRDRFRTEEIVEEVTLTRYLDYSIDFAAGTIIFKQPVFSQDASFNPTFIEVEYEVANDGVGEEIVAGTRIAYRLDEQDSEVAVTYVNDGTKGQGGDLLGLDLTWQITDDEKLTAEIASSETDLEGSADAYLVELEHASERLAGKIYIREQDEGFGLGHQSALETGTRKMGLEGEYRVSDELVMRAQAFQQTLLGTGADRTIANAEGEYLVGETRLATGVQSVRERTADGGSLDANQITLGASRKLWRNKLLVRGDAEIDVGSGGGNTDYPSRAILGVEYEVLSGVNVISEQEFSWGGSRDTQDTRFGVKSRPWAGADVSSIVTRQHAENGERLFATTGLLQQWRMNERWLIDFGVDRVSTMSESGEPFDPNELLFNPTLPAASGSFNEDFMAVFTGAGYRHENWDASTRLEFHSGDQADKWNLLAGANHQLADGKVMSASFSLLNEETSTGAIQDLADLRFGIAWRPNESSWTFLNRTDLVFEERVDVVFDARTRKWVNNFNANFKPQGPHQLSLQAGFKYVVDHIDGREYSGVTSLLGAEYRYDLTARLDLSVRGSTLESHETGTRDYSYGLSLGYNVLDNAWLSVGYNLAGFEDDDFVMAEYTAKGPYVKLRMKLDQHMARRFLEFAGVGESRKLQSYGNSR